MRQADLIAVSGFTATRMAMDYQLAKHGIRVQGHHLEVQHHATAINLVAAGVGDAILPSSTFQEADRPGVIKIALTHPTIKRHIVMITRKNATLSPAAQDFAQMLLKQKSQFK
jgi:DNA-binding transcriptional LysR family regulator